MDDLEVYCIGLEGSDAVIIIPDSPQLDPTIKIYNLQWPRYVISMDEL